MRMHTIVFSRARVNVLTDEINVILRREMAVSRAQTDRRVHAACTFVHHGSARIRCSILMNGFSTCFERWSLHSSQVENKPAKPSVRPAIAMLGRITNGFSLTS